MRVGIDVGGTNTDAVILDGEDVLSSVKTPTTPDVKTGILAALDSILADARVNETDLEAVMLGTTQFTNAVIERKQLSEVAAIRLGLPSGNGLPPKCGWPTDISELLGDHVYMMQGGTLYDGRELSQVNPGESRTIIQDIKRKGLNAVAISAAFSPMSPRCELELANQLQRAVPGIRVTCSHLIGRLGLLERENAAILNAALLDFASRFVSSFQEALRDRGFTCPFFISQNDGTLMDVDFVKRFPALTFASGPTNSIRGACKLTGLDNAIVIDIGGTTSDIGILVDGFPRESNTVIEVGGVRTNFRMPDVLALGLGGGSLVLDNGTLIGPESVGHRLPTEGLAFGGDQLTATDLLVAAGKSNVGRGTGSFVLPPETITNGLETIQNMLNLGIEKMKPSSVPLPVILVGGGSLLVTGKLDAASELVRPQHAGVANAIGAAMAQIGGEIERLVCYGDMPREAFIRELSEQAKRTAVLAGADEDSVRISDIEEIPISYMTEGSMRVRIKAVGDIAQLKRRKTVC